MKEKRELINIHEHLSMSTYALQDSYANMSTVDYKNWSKTRLLNKKKHKTENDHIHLVITKKGYK